VLPSSFLAAWLFGELKQEGFESGASMRRYLLDAVLMGFGGMQAGGWQGAAQWARACRARPSSRSPHGSRCAACGLVRRVQTG